MATNYAGLAATAERLITNAGRAVTFYSPASGLVYDPVTGNDVAGTDEVSVIGQGVKLNYKSSEFNELVQAGDAKLLYSGEAPTIGQYIDLDGETWRVVNSDPLNPAGTVLLYKVQIRR